ncbi:MAG: hypothetical protein ACK55I_39410, partial [bacterium]
PCQQLVELFARDQHTGLVVGQQPIEFLPGNINRGGGFAGRSLLPRPRRSRRLGQEGGSKSQPNPHQYGQPTTFTHQADSREQTLSDETRESTTQLPDLAQSSYT